MALGCTLRELEERMDSKEYTEWQQFYSIEPFGGPVADLRVGIQCATMVNMWRGKGSRAARPQDFMPQYTQRASKGQSVEEMKARIMLFAKAHNAAIEKAAG